VLILSRHAPPLGDVLTGLAHRLRRPFLGEARVDEAPAERRVVQLAVAARPRLARLRGHERRARHRLDAAGHEQLAVARDDGMTGGHDRRQARRAEAVERDTRGRIRKTGEQRAEARDVAVVLARLVRAAEVDVLDLAGADARAL